MENKTEQEPSERQKKRFYKAIGIDKNTYGLLEEEPCLRCVLDKEKIDCKGVKIE